MNDLDSKAVIFNKMDIQMNIMSFIAPSDQFLQFNRQNIIKYQQDKCYKIEINNVLLEMNLISFLENLKHQYLTLVAKNYLS